MHPWHDVDPERIKPDKFLAFIEISKGSKNKYELDKSLGRLILDRVLFTSTHYPQNYGFIPRTYASDYDPLDVLVLCSESIVPAAFVEAKPIGVLVMSDNGLNDEKIIAVADNDPFYNCYNDISQLPSHVMDEIKHFFSVYTTLEGKHTAVYTIKGSVEAKRIIEQYTKEYDQKIAPEVRELRRKRGY